MEGCGMAGHGVVWYREGKGTGKVEIKREGKGVVMVTMTVFVFSP